MTDYPTIVGLIAQTQTQTGLRVKCALDTHYYPTKVQISQAQMDRLDLLNHTILPDWNYTLFPRLNRN